MLGLGWLGRIAHRGMICRHLGYPIGVEVSHVKVFEWVSKRLEDNFMYWRSQIWLFHVRLKVVQLIYGLYGVLLSSFVTMVKESS